MALGATVVRVQIDIIWKTLRMALIGIVLVRCIVCHGAWHYFSVVCIEPNDPQLYQHDSAFDCRGDRGRLCSCSAGGANNPMRALRSN